MPAGQRGPLSTRGTSEAGGGVLLKSFTPVSDFTEETPQSAYGCQLPFQGSLLRKLFVCSSTAMSKPSGVIRSLPSLSAWGMPTPVVAFSCIGNVDIQVFSCAGGQLYLIRRLQVYLFIIFHVQPILQGVTLLFFFAKKKKRSKKRKEFAFHLYCKIPISPEDYTRNCHHRFSSTKLSRRGIQAAAAAVTLPFLH